MFKKLQMGLGIDSSKMEQYNDAKEQLRFNNMMMNEVTMTKQEKLEHENETNKNNELTKVDKSRPHLFNLNQDPQLSQRIFYSIDNQTTKVGKRGAEPTNDIELGGMVIRNLHAIITKSEEGLLFVEPIYHEEEDSNCYINGDPIVEKIELKHYDRLTFATNNMFVVQIPGGEKRDDIDVKTIDWDYAQNQLYLRKEMIEKEQMEEK